MKIHKYEFNTIKILQINIFNKSKLSVCKLTKTVKNKKNVPEIKINL